MRFLTPNFRITGIDKFSLEHEIAYKKLQQLYEGQSEKKEVTIFSMLKTNIPIQALILLLILSIALNIHQIQKNRRITTNNLLGYEYKKESNIEDYRELISIGQTSQSIELLMNKAKSEGRGEILNHLINLSSQLKRYNSKNLIGINENDIDINKINDSVLKIIDELFRNSKK